MCSYQILRPFSCSNIYILLRAFLVYVHPKLEYNTPIWSPYLHKEIISVESVRRNFTKSICNRCNISYNFYSDRLNKLGIRSLEYRRVEFDLILTYKICYQLREIPFSHFFEYYNSGYDLRRHKLTLKSVKCMPKFKSYSNFYCNRIPAVWNSLPEDIVLSSKWHFFKETTFPV